MIEITGIPRSSKNSKIWTGEFLINSETVQLYKKLTKSQWEDKNNIESFKQIFKRRHKPYLVKFHFVVPDKRRRDFHNFVQLPLDLMVEYGWIEDDNMDILFPVPLIYNGKLGKSVDKENPRIIISA